MINCCGRSSCTNIKLKKKPPLKIQNISGQIGRMTLAIVTKTQTSTQALEITEDDTSNAENSMDPSHETTNSVVFQSSEVTISSYQSFSTSAKSAVNQESASTSSTQKMSSVSSLRSEPDKGSTNESNTSENLSSQSSSFSSSSSSTA